MLALPTLLGYCQAQIAQVPWKRKEKDSRSGVGVTAMVSGAIGEDSPITPWRLKERRMKPPFVCAEENSGLSSLGSGWGVAFILSTSLPVSQVPFSMTRISGAKLAEAHLLIHSSDPWPGQSPSVMKTHLKYLCWTVTFFLLNCGLRTEEINVCNTECCHRMAPEAHVWDSALASSLWWKFVPKTLWRRAREDTAGFTPCSLWDTSLQDTEQVLRT